MTPSIAILSVQSQHDSMTTTFRSVVTTSICSALLLTAGFAIADEPPVLSSITFEMKSQTPEGGTLTLVDPQQESKVLPRQLYTLKNPVPGNYTVIAAPPAGSTTEMQLWSGSLLVRTEPIPQISFPVSLTSHIKIVAIFSLSEFGTVGVTSDPPGIPFELQGPGSMKVKGVTPQTFSQTPIGNYGVRFMPKGCPEPPPKADNLLNGLKVYLTVSIKCDTFIPTAGGENSTMSQAQLFTDVPNNVWFSPFVYKVTKLGIMAGYKDENGDSTGTFGPDQPVTIAELSKIAHTMLGIDPAADTHELEHASAADTWFESYIRSAEGHDWTVFLDPELDFNRPATRGEVVATFLQELNLPLQWPTGQLFHDVSRRTPYAAAIESAVKLKIVSGKNDDAGNLTGMFGPSDPINRAELTKILAIIIDQYRTSSSSSR